MNSSRFSFFTVKLIAATAIATGISIGQERRPLPQKQMAQSIAIQTQLDGAIVPCADGPIGFCATGTVHSGLLKGTKEAVYLGASPSAGMPGVEEPSTISYSATQVFHTDHGDLHMSVVGVSDYARWIFTEVARITGGTGRFTGATGNLFISGTFAANGAQFESHVTGEICLDQTSPRRR